MTKSPLPIGMESVAKPIDCNPYLPDVASYIVQARLSHKVAVQPPLHERLRAFLQGKRLSPTTRGRKSVFSLLVVVKEHEGVRTLLGATFCPKKHPEYFGHYLKVDFFLEEDILRKLAANQGTPFEWPDPDDMGKRLWVQFI